jgi:ribosome-associated translation inhibitor RaiA
MKLNYSKKNIILTDSQIDYITKKIIHLKKLARRLDDEASHAEIDIEKVSSAFKNISMKINLKVPNYFFRVDILADTVEEAIDLSEEKLKVQIEKYKSKYGKNDMHRVKGLKDNILEEEIDEFI